MQQYALTYQWLDFKNQPALLDQPEELVSADDSPAFKHVAIHLCRPDDDVTELVIQCQSGNAKGVVLIHTQDDLPAQEQGPPPCDDVKIPVVLIGRRAGEGLLKEVQDSSKTVNVVIVRESGVDAGVPEYQTPDVRFDMLAAASCVAETSGRTKRKKFHLTRNMEKLLYESRTRQPVVMCKDHERFCRTFQLLDEYEHDSSERTVNSSKLKNKVQKLCDHLTKCMRRNYLADFPYHCLMVFRLQS